MKKIKDVWLLIAGILLILISYKVDVFVNLFFKNNRLVIADALFSLITNFGLVVLFMLIVPSIVLYRRNAKSIYILWLTFIVSFILTFISKLIVLRQRPLEAFNPPFADIFNQPFVNILIYSFPSMHALVAFSLLPILIKNMPKQKYFWITFAFLVAFSRIYLGFHFLSDVVFGAVFGYFIGTYLLELYENGKLWKTKILR